MTIQGSKVDSISPAPVAAPVTERVAAAATPVRVVPVAPVQTVQKQPPKPQEDLRQVRADVARRLEQFLKESGRDVEFRVDDVARATVITVRRADTGEVVRQFPTEEALALLRRLNEQSGTFLDLMV
jgi:flagellar protein FlaG